MNLIGLLRSQFLRNVEHLFQCEIFSIFNGMPIVWVILLHEYRCLHNAEDIHNHHITESLSLSSVTFFENRFCLRRTWSFTLFKNDLDPHDNSNSASAKEFVSLVSTVNRSAGCEQTTGPTLEKTKFYQCSILSGLMSVPNNGSPLSVVLLSLQTQRALTFVSGLPRAFWCSRGCFGSPFTAPRDQIHHRLRFCFDSFFTWIFSTSFENNWLNWNG